MQFRDNKNWLVGREVRRRRRARLAEPLAKKTLTRSQLHFFFHDLPKSRQKLVMYPSRKGLVGSKPYLTMLSIDENNLYYEGRDRVSLPEGSRRGIMLYNLK